MEVHAGHEGSLRRVGLGGREEEQERGREGGEREKEREGGEREEEREGGRREGGRTIYSCTTKIIITFPGCRRHAKKLFCNVVVAGSTPWKNCSWVTSHAAAKP